MISICFYATKIMQLCYTIQKNDEKKNSHIIEK